MTRDPSSIAAGSFGAAHVVAVVGGATAGAEVAGRLAQRGAQVVVFDQNARPYGKVEDGLPRWHHALRLKEYETIAGKLARPGVHFVPRTRIGRDLTFEQITRGIGFSAIVLAIGAWRDRPLPIDGADAFVGRGLVYQNPFVISYNHTHDATFTGQRYAIEDGALVVGGGLASIDVAKIHMLESVRTALRARGIDAPLLELEVGGIPKLLAKHGLVFEQLGLAGCTIFYRRRVEDMPMLEAPEGADAGRIAKVEQGRVRMLEKATEKYLFRLEALAAPEALLIENGRLVGLRFRRNRIENGRPVPTDATFERRGTYVVSSIGSIPEPIPGIPMKGDLFAYSDPDFGRLPGYDNLFSVGNVVTGKGNIVASRKHAAHVSQDAIEKYLGLSENGHDGEEDVLSARDAILDAQAEAVAEAIHARPPLSSEGVASILDLVAKRQRLVGYDGNLASWLAALPPPASE